MVARDPAQPMLSAFLVVLTLASAPARAAVKNCLKTHPRPRTLERLRECQDDARAAAIERANRKGAPLTGAQLDAIDDQQRAEARDFFNGGDETVVRGKVKIDDGVSAADRRASEAAKAAGAPTLPDAVMPAVDGSKASDLISCPARKCLTLVVAPWCPYCRAATSNIVKLRAYLKRRGIPSRVVVTADESDTLSDYAEKFGGDALYDPDRLIKVRGFPYYCVSAKGGAILKQGPFDDAAIGDPAQWTASIGLP